MSYFDPRRSDDQAYCHGFNAGWLDGFNEGKRGEMVLGFFLGVAVGVLGLATLIKILNQ